jgi:hypothetical protein
MIALITILLFFSLSSIAYAGNSVYIEQITTSDDTIISITQDGQDNSVNFTMAHDDNSITIYQEGNNNEVSWVSYWGSGKSWGGDLDGTGNVLNFKQHNTTGSDSNKIGFHIPSNDNDVTICQGATFDSRSDTTCSGSTPSSEYGGHTVNLDLHSGGNTLKIGQETGTGNADHYAQIYTYGGDNNSVFVKQKGNGNKSLYLTIRTDGAEQDIIQTGNGVHTATIDLQGSYGTDLSLTQNSNSNKTYSLTQNCQTSGGCSVTVTQN